VGWLRGAISFDLARVGYRFDLDDLPCALQFHGR
jgi:hypothetical protein